MRQVFRQADIRLREHQPAEVRLANEEVSLLRREFSDRLSVLPTSAPEIHILEPRQYVGFIVLPTDRIIEIRPKVRIGVLFAMLAKKYQLGKFESDPAGQAAVAELFEFVVQIFTSRVEDLVAQGVLRSFRECRDPLHAPRGKILVTETLRRQPAVRERHWCQFTEFTADIAENQILKLACHNLMGFPYKKIPALSSRLRRLLRALAEVTLDPQAADSFEQLVYHRLNEHYRPALSLAQMLLAYLSPSGARGKKRFLAFLVNMDTLFQEYVTAVLKDGAWGTDLDVVSQDPHHRLDLARQLVVRPDVVVYRAGTPSLVIDAKYKPSEANADVYQALGYCHALAIPRAVLVYPESKPVRQSRHRIRPSGDIEVRVRTLDLSGGVDDLEEEAERLANWIWDRVKGDGRPGAVEAETVTHRAH